MPKINQTFKEVGAADGTWVVRDRPWILPSYVPSGPSEMAKLTEQELADARVRVNRRVDYVIYDPPFLRNDDPIGGAESELLFVGGRFEAGRGWINPPVMYVPSGGAIDDEVIRECLQYGDVLRNSDLRISTPAEFPFVVCSKCGRRITPEDSYPVVWTGTKSLAELCEECFRAEEVAGRAKPCIGLDEEAT